ncbi:LysR family transcriptional regulator [Caballeronia udeis]|uniref:LysR family transcriptional regulator n=1 Tax=Caballeronia udeis TaxID=1232866 RepID=A0A158HX38_9BURK|nr:LysR substrate-binding domain-containing protein [Caballeronia udeis]SAL48539.1 LysR family transcriptional regulator [Caballeronia udeis]
MASAPILTDGGGRLPPLQTLAYFDAAARHLNFTSAARELGTSQPAVSHRISALEADLGMPLFKRLHRGVELTEEGANLFEAVFESLDSIRSRVSDIRSRRRRRTLTLATDFGFASYWLLPRLAELRSLMPEFDVRITSSQQDFDAMRDHADLAITFGSGRWSGCTVQRLFAETVVPVCAPSLLKNTEDQLSRRDLAAQRFLHLESAVPARWLTWADWFNEHDFTPAPDSRHFTFNSYSNVIEATVAGQGVALGWIPLIDPLIKNGSLAIASNRTMTTSGGYYLLVPPTDRFGEARDQLVRWLLAECGKDGQHQARWVEIASKRYRNPVATLDPA